MIDSEVAFEQQASILLEKSKGQAGGTQTLHISSLNTSSNIVIDNIYSRVNTIEEKLNACDSIYRLATQANTQSEKEKRGQFQSFIDKSNSVDKNISNLEYKTASIEQMIKDTVHNEIQQFNKTNESVLQATEAISKLTERLNSIEKQYVSGTKKNSKELKRLKLDIQLTKSQHRDDNRVDEIIAQLSEMKRQQAAMFDLLSSMQNLNYPDLQNVNSQLSQLWAQLSTKHSESISKH